LHNLAILEVEQGDFLAFQFFDLLRTALVLGFQFPHHTVDGDYLVRIPKGKHILTQLQH
jgi:hypothetical protein